MAIPSLACSTPGIPDLKAADVMVMLEVNGFEVFVGSFMNSCWDLKAISFPFFY